MEKVVVHNSRYDGSNLTGVGTAKRIVVKVKLTFIDRSGSNCSTFYLYRATSVGLSNNPLLYTCASM